jgi:hypothetical protein
LPLAPETRSAIVFFTIFSEMFLKELGVPGLGTSYDVAQGFAVIFRMSLGAVASGVLFGWGTRVLLYLLKRRLSREECVVEVATTFTMAYLSYFVTDQVFHCSGVIGTLTYGVLINHSAFINDRKLMEDFWALVEHLLNTVLFTLGGLVWGEIIANGNPEKQFSGTDWGYLFVLYVFLMLIRFFLLFSFYPVTKSIGLGTNLQETLFASFAGLRGAVGIALAIYIDNIVDAENIASFENETNRLFGYVGGVAFLTLAINATLSGPLLRRLGLADRPVIREKVVSVMNWRIRQRVLDDMVTLFSEPRFHRVNFSVVRHHIPMIQDLSMNELESAVRKFKRPRGKFLSRDSVPNLRSVAMYIANGPDKADNANDVSNVTFLLHGLSERDDEHQDFPRRRRSQAADGMANGGKDGGDSPLSVVECRRLFLGILRASYVFQVEEGELADREFLSQALNQSLDFAVSDVGKGLPLNEWRHTNLVTYRYPLLLRMAKWVPFALSERAQQQLDRQEMKYDVDRCVSYLEAHRRSREVFKTEFVLDCDNMTDAEATVLRESDAACAEAVALLESFPARSVEAMISHRFCSILLNSVVHHFEDLARSGLLSAKEAEDFVSEIQSMILRIDSCPDDEHPEELPVPGSTNGAIETTIVDEPCAKDE